MEQNKGEEKINLQRLIELAQGERTLRQYAEDAGVSPSNISRIKKGEYKPRPDMIAKLTRGNAKPRGGVTYEDLMVATGYQEDFISDTFITIEEINVKNDESNIAEYAAHLTRNEKIKKMHMYRKEQAQFETTCVGLICSALAKKEKSFLPQSREKEFYRGYRPDLVVKVFDTTIDTWWFEFILKREINDNYRELHARNFFDRFMGRLVWIPVDPKRKISIVTNDEDLYDSYKRFANKTSFKGELSLMLVDVDKLELVEERYIAHYGDSDQNEIYIVE